MRTSETLDFVLGDNPPPESAMEMAATLLLDTLGVAAGAADSDAGRIVRDHAVRFMAPGTPADGATLLFDGRKTGIPGAGFALASQIDNLDAHDGFNPVKGHIGCAVVPALLALAETRPDLSARDALTAMVMGYEVGARAGLALHGTVQDYHTSGAWNALGVVTVGARLLGLDHDQTRHALGIAEYHGPRSQMMREIANPTMLHDGSGMGAMVGLMAVLLAQDGFTGAPALTVEHEDTAHLWLDLGATWTIEQNYIKPYPSCRWGHAAIDAMGQLVDRHRFRPQDVVRIEINCFAEAAALFQGVPRTTSEAQYSLPFVTAARLVFGTLGPEQVQGAALTDPRVAALIARTDVNVEPRHDARFPDGRWSDVVIHLQDGQQLKSDDVSAHGGPDDPMTLDEVEAKFRLMTRALNANRVDELWAMRARLLDRGSTLDMLYPLIHPAG